MPQLFVEAFNAVGPYDPEDSQPLHRLFRVWLRLLQSDAALFLLLEFSGAVPNSILDEIIRSQQQKCAATTAHPSSTTTSSSAVSAASVYYQKWLDWILSRESMHIQFKFLFSAAVKVCAVCHQHPACVLSILASASVPEKILKDENILANLQACFMACLERLPKQFTLPPMFFSLHFGRFSNSSALEAESVSSPKTRSSIKKTAQEAEFSSNANNNDSLQEVTKKLQEEEIVHQHIDLHNIHFVTAVMVDFPDFPCLVRKLPSSTASIKIVRGKPYEEMFCSITGTYDGTAAANNKNTSSFGLSVKLFDSLYPESSNDMSAMTPKGKQENNEVVNCHDDIPWDPYQSRNTMSHCGSVGFLRLAKVPLLDSDDITLARASCTGRQQELPTPMSSEKKVGEGARGRKNVKQQGAGICTAGDVDGVSRLKQQDINLASPLCGLLGVFNNVTNISALLGAVNHMPLSYAKVLHLFARRVLCLLPPSMRGVGLARGRKKTTNKPSSSSFFQSHFHPSSATNKNNEAESEEEEARNLHVLSLSQKLAYAALLQCHFLPVEIKSRESLSVETSCLVVQLASLRPMCVKMQKLAICTLGLILPPKFCFFLLYGHLAFLTQFPVYQGVEGGGGSGVGRAKGQKKQNQAAILFLKLIFGADNNHDIPTIGQHLHPVAWPLVAQFIVLNKIEEQWIGSDCPYSGLNLAPWVKKHDQRLLRTRRGVNDSHRSEEEKGGGSVCEPAAKRLRTEGNVTPPPRSRSPLPAATSVVDPMHQQSAADDKLKTRKSITPPPQIGYSDFADLWYLLELRAKNF